MKIYNLKKTRKESQYNYNKTNKQKYGTNKPTATQEIKNKITNTIQERYGVQTYFETKDIILKRRQWCKSLYGVDTYVKTEDYQQKRKTTCFNRYGSETPLHSHQVLEKIKQTNLHKYGNEYYLGSNEHKKCVNEYMSKIYKSKKENKSINTSKIENEIFLMLQTKFQDVTKQYKPINYPGIADFYIPSINTIIEYQGTWTHGISKYDCHCPYDENNEHHKNVVKLMESKNSKYYDSAINCWVVRDVQKRKWAKEHNEYKWIEFFDMNEFNEWFNNQ